MSFGPLVPRGSCQVIRFIQSWHLKLETPTQHVGGVLCGQGHPHTPWPPVLSCLQQTSEYLLSPGPPLWGQGEGTDHSSQRKMQAAQSSGLALLGAWVGTGRALGGQQLGST